MCDVSLFVCILGMGLTMFKLHSGAFVFNLDIVYEMDLPSQSAIVDVYLSRHVMYPSILPSSIGVPISSGNIVILPLITSLIATQTTHYSQIQSNH